MTLVVARKVQGAIFLVGDTKLTNEKTKEKTSVTKGVIKTKLLSDQLAVSFAGNEYLADNAIRALGAETDRDVVISSLLAFHLSVEVDEERPDFIVASLSPTVDLATIKDKKTEHAQNAWIGDAQSYELLRAYETGNRQPVSLVSGSASLAIEQLSDRRGEVPAGVETYTRMLQCMRHVVDDEAAAYVGGFAIPVVGSNDVFAFMSYAGVKTHPLVFEEGQNIVPFGTAMEGGYSYDIVATGDHRGLSSYFLQGRFGIIYREVDGGLLRPHIVRDVSPIEFEEYGSSVLGLSVSTYYADNRILCQRALDKLSTGDKDGAVLDANRAIERAPLQSDPWKCRGMVWSKLGDENQALHDFRRAVEVAPQDADAWNKLGLSYKTLKQADKAMEAISEAVKCDPAFWRAFANRATMQWEAGQIEGALSDLTDALLLQPENANLWRNRAAVYARLDLPIDALACIRVALQLLPDNNDIQTAAAALEATIKARAAAITARDAKDA